MPESESQNESSLYFLSTQIQSRHEDQEHVDSNLQRLQRFKNTLEPPNTRVQEAKVKRSKKKPTKRSKGSKITSISAFVRETLGNKKITNTQGILDYFTGDTNKVNEFINKMESATSTPHLLSRRQAGDKSNVLFSEAEWKAFVEKLRLRFPNLSSKNRKSLKAVSKRLAKLRDLEPPSDSKAIWTQAARQPSSELTPEDMKWLYDLEEDQLMNETTIDEEPVQQGQYCFTLSQVLGESQLNLSLEERRPNEVVTDSEPEFCELTPGEIEDLMQPAPSVLSLDSPERAALGASQETQTSHTQAQTQYTQLTQNATLEEESGLAPVTPKKPVRVYQFDRDATLPPHQKQSSSSVDVLTSIAFAPTYEAAEKSTEIENSSPVDSQIEDIFKTPTKWPDHLQISSSPLSSRKKDRSLQAARGLPLKNPHLDSEFLCMSPIKRSSGDESEVIEFRGQVELSENARFILKTLPTPLFLGQPQDHVSDSEEEDHEVSYIEITKPVELSEVNAFNSFLQVPSSP